MRTARAYNEASEKYRYGSGAVPEEDKGTEDRAIGETVVEEETRYALLHSNAEEKECMRSIKYSREEWFWIPKGFYN